ncbi:MAG: fluoride efflux transporter CrcB [Saprospiraceae bacterium]|uniref:Fluoride-specific ion channel FluC n=1 Tax=Lacibacter cauensis TaxID=510947 RepID=A0A562SJW2_9BACT|nr:fluoride efflux transporter CrcB [Lacibacter cauensis]MDX2278095.1 fluoride efflux transporter CrcB [Saprospiraceae bacterium]TWI81126.1 CrcB protein [Lacibacter cauensis]
MLKIIISICLGGAMGSLLRYATGVWIARHSHFVFPYATFAVNVVGCFFIGLFYAFSERYHWFTPEWRLFFITGFCGGLTTFSAFAYENIKLLQEGNTLLFVLYSLGSFAAALLAVVAGINSIKLI